MFVFLFFVIILICIGVSSWNVFRKFVFTFNYFSMAFDVLLLLRPLLTNELLQLLLVCFLLFLIVFSRIICYYSMKWKRVNFLKLTNFFFHCEIHSIRLTINLTLISIFFLPLSVKLVRRWQRHFTFLKVVCGFIAAFLFQYKLQQSLTGNTSFFEYARIVTSQLF